MPRMNSRTLKPGEPFQLTNAELSWCNKVHQLTTDLLSCIHKMPTRERVMLMMAAKGDGHAASAIALEDRTTAALSEFKRLAGAVINKGGVMEIPLPSRSPKPKKEKRRVRAVRPEEPAQGGASAEDDLQH